MKYSKLLLGFFALILFAGVQKSYAENPPIYPDNLNKHITEEIYYPEDAKMENIEGFVLVSFTISDDGYVKISGMNASNETLKDFVQEKLQSIRLCPYDRSVGKEFNMKFDFKILKE